MLAHKLSLTRSRLLPFNRVYELPEETRTCGPRRPKSLSDLLQTSMPKVSEPRAPQLGFGGEGVETQTVNIAAVAWLVLLVAWRL